MKHLSAPVVGIVGLGSMGAAIAHGLSAHSTPLVGHGRSRSHAAVTMLPDVASVFREATVVIVAVKPHLFEELGAEIPWGESSVSIVISVAAGHSVQGVRQLLRVPDGVAVVRTMPNLAAQVGRSCTGIFSPDAAAQSFAAGLLGHIGSTVILAREEQFHGFTALAGSGPAFAFMFAEALTDAAVREGLTRAQARSAAAQMLAGAAALLEDTNVCPAALKDQVCSPAGTTIEGVAALEANGMRHATMSAVSAAAARSRAMGGQ